MEQPSDISKVKDYWDSRPCNIRHSPSPEGSWTWSTEIMSRKYFVEPHIPDFAEFYKWKDKQVLEIGCGIGTDSIAFALAGARVTAIDVSEKSLNIARQRATLHGVSDRINFIFCDMEDIAFFAPIKHYDLIYAWGTIHHTPHPSRAIDGIAAVMSPDTVLKIMVYHRISTKVLAILLKERQFWNIDQAVARHSEAQTGCPFTRTYTRKSVEQLLSGLKVTKKDVHHIFPYRVADYVNYRYVRNWWWRMLPDSVFHRLERLFGWHLCVEATL